MSAATGSVVLDAVRRAIKQLTKLQVELHGKYSLDRMRRFHAYSTKTSWWRILFWCVFTPIPCLVYNTLMDLAPLVKPSLGRDANYMFWIRLVFIVIPITYGIFSQIGFLTPRLNMTRRDAGVTSVFVTSLCLAYDYLIAGYIPLPVPFFFLAATLPFLFAMGTMIAILFGKKLVQDAELRMSFYRAMAVIITELSLTVIYPIYIYGFNSIPSSYQSPYMTLVPLMKVISKNVMSKFVGRMDDLKPEVLIFNVDTFNALYVTLAMQKATTISTSLLIMLIDTAQGCISISDVYNAYMPIKRLMKKLPKDHSLQGKSFIEVAIALDTCMVEAKQASAPVATLYDGQVGQEEVAVFDGQNLQTKSSIAQLDAAPIKSRNKIYIIPTKATKAPSDSSITVAVGRTNSTFTTARSTSQVSAPLSEKDCAAFLLATRRMLFTIEFVILIEYSEVIIPVFYSLCTAAEYHLPNRQFYAAIASIDEQQLRSMVTSVLGYACLEFVSLAIMSLVLHRITGLSPMRQVGFVLEKQNGMIQAKLLSWVLYAVQNALEHLGADFSFRFKWLQSA